VEDGGIGTMTILETVPRAESGDNRNAPLLGGVLDPDGARHRRLSLGALAIAVEVRKWHWPAVLAIRKYVGC
jgi:hypothetical protein